MAEGGIAERLKSEPAELQARLRVLMADIPGAAEAIKDEATRRDVLLAFGNFNRALLGAGRVGEAPPSVDPLWQRLNLEGRDVSLFWKGTLGGLRQIEDSLSVTVRSDYAAAVKALLGAFGLPEQELR